MRAGQTFRGAASVLAVMAATRFPSETMPCANTIHSWVLRWGHYQLHRPLPQGEDWAWFIDLTLTIGPHKVLVIAGARLSEIPFAERALAPTDLQVVHVAVLAKSTHATIGPELQAAEKRTGCPRVIITDEGSDLLKAIRLYREERPTVGHVLDLAHVGANLLKKRFTGQPRWAEFVQKLTQTNQQIRQTELAYLLSPRLRDKGRFMSVGVVLRFARRVLYWLDQSLADARGEKAYGWLRDYRAELAEWCQDQEVVRGAIAQVRDHGWHAGTLRALERQWASIPVDSPSLELVAELRAFAQEMTAVPVSAEETWPGSTEVLESCFGQWKRVVEAGPSVGVSGLVLALGSVMKPAEASEYRTALDATPLKRVWKWLKENVGPTLQQFRRAFHRQTAGAIP